VIGRIQPARRPSSTFPTRLHPTHCKQSGFKSFSFYTYRQFRASPSLPRRPRRRPARLFCCCDLSSLTPLFTTLISMFRVLAEIDRNRRTVTSLFATHPKNASVSPLLATHFQKHTGWRPGAAGRALPAIRGADDTVHSPACASRHQWLCY